DKVCDAIELIPNEECYTAPYTNIGAYGELYEPKGSCATYETGNNSVWFSFVATDENATVTTDFPGTNFLTEMAVFEAPENCEDLSTMGVEVGCSNWQNPNIELNNLDIGSTYYVQVTGLNNDEGNFCIEIQM